jgi:pilus assembly protein CpaF
VKQLIDEAIFTELCEVIQQEIDFTEHITDEQLMLMIETKVTVLANERRWISDERLHLTERLFAYFRGLDVLEPLMKDASVTEIMVNGANHIFFEREGRIQQYDYSFVSNHRLEDLIQVMVSKVNRTVNESSPIVDARLPDGSRVHVVLPPVALNGPVVTIRKFPERQLTINDLITKGTITDAAASFLQQAVLTGHNVFISGGTGAGKTTLLNVLAQSIPLDERVITIEDSAELQLDHIPNWVSLETRLSNTEGKGEITIRQLIRAALRMRPNRLIVGEVRGSEAIDMLQAMNTGHDGSISTGHANSVRDMLSRLETMAMGGTDLPVQNIRQQIASAIHIVVHVSRKHRYERKVIEITEISGISNGEYELNALFAWKSEFDEEEEVGQLVATGKQLIRNEKWRGRSNK